MTLTPEAQLFLERFHGLLARMRRVRTATAICTAAFALAACAALVAWVDYRWELALGIRRVLTPLLAVMVAAGLAWTVIAVLRRWGRPRTAIELERQFPDLGQRVRTTVEFGGRSDESIRADGVATTLVEALALETTERTRPLELDTVVPTHRLALAATLLVAAGLGLAGSLAVNSEWRTALARTLLADTPYTTLSVEPGNATVDEGGSVDATITLAGRTDRHVTLYSRPAMRPNADWTEETLHEPLGTADPAAEGRLRPAAGKKGKAGEPVPPPAESSGKLVLRPRFARVGEPMDYRVVVRRSGKDSSVVAESLVHRIGVRYPLAIKEVETVVAPPEYTGLAPKSFADGNVTALVGSRGTFKVTLDRVPSRARFEIRPEGAGADGPAPSQMVPGHIDGTHVTMELPLSADFRWSLSADSPDGTPLPANAFRVRVREDQPPQVSFLGPDDELEVHGLAEVAMKIRASDDYGVARSGIVFQVNNEEEHTLAEEEFAAVAEAAAEAAATGRLPPRTRAVLEKLLPLEHFGLTQKDFVAYYAYAEDNFPEGGRRAETDIRFIDIRPFKMIYQIIEPQDQPPGEGPRIMALEEIIRRQRYALNRTIRLEKRPDRWGDGELNTVDRLMEYETELAQATRDLAEFFEGRGTEGADVLFQAEAAMLAAVDSLSIGQFATAVLQEKDALQHLVEARNRLIIALTLDPALAAAVRQTDRRLAQKLRRPKNEEEEKREERVIERLMQLAMNQDQVAQGLAAMRNQNAAGNGQGKRQSPSEGKPGEQKPADGSSSGDQPESPGDMPQGAEDASAEPGEGDPAEGDAAEGETAEGDPTEEQGTDPAEGDGPKAAPEGPNGEGEGGPGEPATAGTDPAEASQPAAEGEATGDEPSAEGDGKSETDGDGSGPAAGQPTLEQLADKQTDIVLEASDLAGILAGLEDVTDLARERMKAGAARSDEVAAAIGRGDTDEAARTARMAADELAEVARHVAGLLADETPQKVAVARDMAAELTFGNRELADEVDRQSAPGNKGERASSDKPEGAGPAGQGEQPSDEQEGPAAAARRLAERGRTLEDVLRAIATSQQSDSAEAVDRVAELIEEGEVSQAVERMQAVPPALADQAMRQEATLEIRDTADQMEVTARVLDRLYRSLVMPRIEELKDLERQAATLQTEMTELATPSQVKEWGQAAGQLTDELEEQGVGGGAREDLEKALGEGGGTGTGGWALSNGYFVGPEQITTNMRLLVEEIQQHIQELMLADMESSGDEALPPSYRRLVERYLEVLSQGPKAP
jgi:hypothetical protein